jgi:hypothetical protein
VTRILGENAGSLGQLGAAEIGLIASGSLFGAMASSTLLIGIGDKNIGRKLELNLAAQMLKSTLDHDFYTVNILGHSERAFRTCVWKMYWGTDLSEFVRRPSTYWAPWYRWCFFVFLTICFQASIYTLGTLLQVAAPSLPVLLAGRVMYGLGIGTAMHVAPLYIGHMSLSLSQCVYVCIVCIVCLSVIYMCIYL